MKYILIIILVLMLPAILVAQRALIWDVDNFSHFPDPDDMTRIIGTEAGVLDVLRDSRNILDSMQYELLLPEDISDYDVVLVLLGCYCSG